MNYVLALNALVSLTSVGFAVAALVRPSALGGVPSSDGATYYARMFAARGIPFGLVAAGVGWIAPGPGTVVVLLAAAIAQAGDGAIGISRRYRQMALSSLVAAAVHVGTALLFL
jgi:hypothetical protein